jgi:hypothetical protein
MWFAVFPTYETLIAQGLAAIVVVGSYYAARHVRRLPSENAAPEPESDAPIVRRLEKAP